MFIPVMAAAHRRNGREMLEERLRRANATSYDRAIAFEAANAAELDGLNEAIGLGRVIRVANGRIFLNQPAVEQRREGLVAGLLLLLLAAGSVVASIAALVAFAGR